MEPLSSPLGLLHGRVLILAPRVGMGRQSTITNFHEREYQDLQH